MAASHQNNFPIVLQNLITVQARKEWDNKKLDLDISPEKEGHHRFVAPPVEVATVIATVSAGISDDNFDQTFLTANQFPLLLK